MEKEKEEVSKNETPGFFAKVKNGIVKFFKGIKNFFVKMGRANSSKCYGIIEGIGDLIVYDDHALISAVGMDDVTFTMENVISYSFAGLGRIRRHKATVIYDIVLDDKVVFPDLVRQKNDVKNVKALINVDKDKAHFFCKGSVEYDKNNSNSTILTNCDIYKYFDCFVIVLKLERQVGEKTEKYEESLLYSYSNVIEIQETKNKNVIIKFVDGKNMYFDASNDAIYDFVKELRDKKIAK